MNDNIRLLDTPESPERVIGQLEEVLSLAQDGHLTDVLIVARRRSTGSLSHWRSLTHTHVPEFLGGLIWTVVGLCTEMGWNPIPPEDDDPNKD